MGCVLLSCLVVAFAVVHTPIFTCLSVLYIIVHLFFFFFWQFAQHFRAFYQILHSLEERISTMLLL